MLTIRKADERQYQVRSNRETWQTFGPQHPEARSDQGFGVLRTLNEGRFPPDVSSSQPRQEVEFITYVYAGTITYSDSMGQTGILRAGEFQRVAAGRGLRYSEANTSSTEWAHVFQIWLQSRGAPLESSHEERRFAAGERRGVLRVVASPDARQGSLRLRQDASLYSSILDPGQHLVHGLDEGRAAWLHVVRGEVSLGASTLGTGDGVGVSGERSLSVTARVGSELLLLDLPAPAELMSNGGGVETSAWLVTDAAQ